MYSINPKWILQLEYIEDQKLPAQLNHLPNKSASVALYLAISNKVSSPS